MRRIAPLRAVNVGGHKRLPMAELRALFETLGLTPAETVLQSGNAVFEGLPGAGAKLERTLEVAAEEHLGLETAFIVRSAAEWDAAVRGNPFAQAARDAPSKLAVVFLKRAPSAAALASLQQSIRGRERVAAKGKQAYVVYPGGIGRSPPRHSRRHWAAPALPGTGTPCGGSSRRSAPARVPPSPDPALESVGKGPN